MKTINRRSFIQNVGLGAGAAMLLNWLPKEAFSAARFLDIPIGFQTFPIRDMLAKDFSGTLKLMAEQGYKLTEMCSPKGYASIGFGRLAEMEPADIKAIINDAGLQCPSCHFGFGEFADEKIDDSI